MTGRVNIKPGLRENAGVITATAYPMSATICHPTHHDSISTLKVRQGLSKWHKFLVKQSFRATRKGLKGEA